MKRVEEHNLNEAIRNLEFLVEVECDAQKRTAYQRSLDAFRRQLLDLARASD